MCHTTLPSTHLLTRHAQLVLHVDLTGCYKCVHAWPFCVAHSLPGALKVWELQQDKSARGWGWGMVECWECGCANEPPANVTISAAGAG